MADKEIIIAGRKMLYGTSIKASPETKSSSTSTFDGAVNQGLDKVGWSIETGKLRYENMTTHRELSETLEKMFSIPQMVTVREKVYPKDETPYVIVDNYFGCLVDGNDYELKPEDKTTESIKFKAESRQRKYENAR